MRHPSFRLSFFLSFGLIAAASVQLASAGSSPWSSQRADYCERLLYHDAMYREVKQKLGNIDSARREGVAIAPVFLESERRIRSWMDYHSRMKAKYQRAIEQHLELVPPDPPRPYRFRDECLEPTILVAYVKFFTIPQEPHPPTKGAAEHSSKPAPHEPSPPVRPDSARPLPPAPKKDDDLRDLMIPTLPEPRPQAK